METVENNLTITSSFEVYNISGSVDNINFKGTVNIGNDTTIISGTMIDKTTEENIGHLHINLNENDLLNVDVRDIKLIYMFNVVKLTKALEQLVKDNIN